MPKRKRIYHPLNTPLEIQQAIASNNPHAFTPDQWRAIVRSAKAKLDLSVKRAQNKRRHRKRNPNWASSIRAAAWFAKNRREVRDEPKQVVAAQEEREMTLAEYEESIRQPSVPAKPAASVTTQARLDYEANLRISRELGKEKGEQGWDD